MLGGRGSQWWVPAWRAVNKVGSTIVPPHPPCPSQTPSFVPARPIALFPFIPTSRRITCFPARPPAGSSVHHRYYPRVAPRSCLPPSRSRCRTTNLTRERLKHDYFSKSSHCVHNSIPIDRSLLYRCPTRPTRPRLIRGLANPVRHTTLAGTTCR